MPLIDQSFESNTYYGGGSRSKDAGGGWWWLVEVRVYQGVARALARASWHASASPPRSAIAISPYMVRDSVPDKEPAGVGNDAIVDNTLV